MPIYVAPSAVGMIANAATVTVIELNMFFEE